MVTVLCFVYDSGRKHSQPKCGDVSGYLDILDATGTMCCYCHSLG